MTASAHIPGNRCMLSLNGGSEMVQRVTAVSGHRGRRARIGWSSDVGRVDALDGREGDGGVLLGLDERRGRPRNGAVNRARLARGARGVVVRDVPASAA